MAVDVRYLRQLVDPPQRTPMPYGLFTVVEARHDGGSHWKNGVEWQPLCGGSGTTFDYCVTGGPGPGFIPTGQRLNRAANPFTVYAEMDCSLPSGNVWGGYYEDVQELLKLTEQYQVEQSFWTGLIGGPGGLTNQVYPHLASNTTVLQSVTGSNATITLQPAATVVVTGAVSATRGIGLLEAAVSGCYDGEAVLHVPNQAIPVMASNVLFFRDGNVLRTFNGNKVVAGAGYGGNTGPDGTPAAAGTAWVYATGAMFMYQGDISVMPQESTLDRSNNTVHAIAQRTYVLGWDCCLYAVQINI
jgi:hypothetical protein